MMETQSNENVALVFQGIAELLEASGENPFKIKAYRNAVRTLESLSEPVAAIAERSELRSIPGFGEAIASKTQEILATGTCELFERLKTEATQKEIQEDTALAPLAEEEDIEAPW